MTDDEFSIMPPSERLFEVERSLREAAVNLAVKADNATRKALRLAAIDYANEAAAIDESVA